MAQLSALASELSDPSSILTLLYTVGSLFRRQGRCIAKYTVSLVDIELGVPSASIKWRTLKIPRCHSMKGRQITIDTVNSFQLLSLTSREGNRKTPSIILTLTHSTPSTLSAEYGQFGHNNDY